MIEINNKKHPDMEGLSFCLKSIGKYRHDTRNHIRHLLIKKGFVVATDGNRLHRYKLFSKYQSGLYRIFKVSKYNIVLVRTKLPISDWPKYEKLFKTKKPHTKFHADFYDRSYPAGLAKVIRSLPNECSINPHHLKDLDDSFDVTISKDQTDPVLFENGNKSAAIMLMRPQGVGI